jgi:hypothetical protein
MELLDGDLFRLLPGFIKSDHKDPVVHARFFIPNGGLSWYVIEGQVEKNEYTFYGILDTVETKFCYFSLREIEFIRGPGGTTVQRDPEFQAKPISQIEDLAQFWKEWNES